MPYKIRKSGDKWEVYNPDTGKVYGIHDTKEEAEAQVKALYAQAPPEDESKKVTITIKMRKKK